MTTSFAYPLDRLQQLAQSTVDAARHQGAEEASVHLSESIGLSINIRQGVAEQSEYAHDKQLVISVRKNGKSGSATTTDLMPQSVNKALEAALDFAHYTSEDPLAGLPDRDWLALDNAAIDAMESTLDAFHPWELNMAQAATMASECEALALKWDSKITNSDGCSLATGMQQGVFANSLGFNRSFRDSHHSLGCAVIAENAQGMQRDGWYEDSRMPLEGQIIHGIAQKAAERTLRRLSPRRLPTGKVPVIFDSTVAPSLFYSLVRSVSGGALYRKASFMLDSLGKLVLPKNISVLEDPFVPLAMASRAFDNEGVRVCARSWINRGVMNGYFLSSYSARKLGTISTGHASGSHNLRVIDDAQVNFSLASMMREMGHGLLVTELMGQGVNGITGDYSRGAAGFWVENGEIAYPVEEVTIAGNLKTMLEGVVAVSDDRLTRGGMSTGAVWINEMMVAGDSSATALPA